MNQPHSPQAPGPEAANPDNATDFPEIVRLLVQHRRLLLVGPLVAGAIAAAISMILPQTFTARTTFMPPQQQQSAASSALASLGALASLTGTGAVRTPADQYVALLESETVANRLIEKFTLKEVYDEALSVDARLIFQRRVRITVGRKDGLISVEVDDRSPQRAAEIANAHVDELRRLTSTLAITEAQQRRAFFEAQLAKTRDQLAAAQTALQASGFNQAALQAEPKAAAESYARLRAQATAGEVRLQTLRGALHDTAPEVRQAQATLGALREQLARSEAATSVATGPDYISKYREFKYQETLFELFARQYELARVDESREGPLVQVVDPALPPERRSAPRRTLLVLGSVLSTALLLLLFVLGRQAWRSSVAELGWSRTASDPMP